MKLSNIVLTALSAVSIFACTRHDADLQVNSVISVTAGVEQTKVGYEGTSVLPSTFVMDIAQGAGAAYDYSLVQMNKDPETNVYTPSEGQELLWADKSHAGVAVKAMTLPYGLSEVDADAPMQVAVCQDQSTEDSVLACDVLVGTNEVSGGISIYGNAINISFRHLLSKLKITCGYGTGLTASDVVFNSVKMKNVCISGGYSYADMQFDVSVSKVYGDVEMFNDASSSMFEALFFPYTPTAGMSSVLFDVTIEGTPYLLTCPMNLKSGGSFVGGKMYTMSVTFANSTVEGTTAQISTGWTEIEPAENQFVAQ